MGSASLYLPPLGRHRHHHHHHRHHHHRAIPLFSFPWPSLHFPPPPLPLALKAFSGAGEGLGVPPEPAPLRAPVTLSGADIFQEEEEEEEDESSGDDDEDEWKRRHERAKEEAKLRRTRDRWDPEWAHWENRILEDTVPLVGFTRMILHTGKYQSGERLSPEHEKVVIERLLTHHPEYEKKIGCGIDYITIGYHPDYETSRCLFIVRKDGESIDFSYWKCIKSLIFKKYPEYADSFILKHFHRKNI